MKQKHTATADEFSRRKKKIDDTILSFNDDEPKILKYLYSEKLKFDTSCISKEYDDIINAQFNKDTQVTDEYIIKNNITTNVLNKNKIDKDLYTLILQLIKCWERPTNGGKKRTKPLKTFPEYLQHEKANELALMIKEKFNTEKGKSIRLLIEVLQANNPQILNYENRQRTAIFEAIRNYFNRYIGHKTSVTDYKFDMETHKEDFNCIKSKVDFILRSLEK